MIDVTIANFETDVIEASKTTPVLGGLLGAVVRSLQDPWPLARES